MAYATFSSCSKSSIRQKPSVCISKFHWDNFWTKSGYIENTNQGFKDKNNQTWTIQRLFDNFTACFKKIIEPEPEKEKKHLHTHLYSQFCCLTRMRAISGNCQYRMNERRTHTPFLPGKSNLLLQRQDLLRPQCSYM